MSQLSHVLKIVGGNTPIIIVEVNTLGHQSMRKHGGNQQSECSHVFNCCFHLLLVFIVLGES